LIAQIRHKITAFFLNVQEKKEKKRQNDAFFLSIQFSAFSFQYSLMADS